MIELLFAAAVVDRGGRMRTAAAPGPASMAAYQAAVDAGLVTGEWVSAGVRVTAAGTAAVEALIASDEPLPETAVDNTVPRRGAEYVTRQREAFRLDALRRVAETGRPVIALYEARRSSEHLVSSPDEWGERLQRSEWTSWACTWACEADGVVAKRWPSGEVSTYEVWIDPAALPPGMLRPERPIEHLSIRDALDALASAS